MKRFIIYILIIGSFAACEKKTEKSVFDDDTQIIAEETPKTYVSMLVEGDQAMQIALYFAANGESYGEDKRANASYDGAGIDKIQFELNTDQLPEKMMIDFNAEPGTNGVRLRGIEIQNEQHAFNLEDKDLAAFFNFSEFVKSTETGIYTFSEVNGKFNPYIQSTPFYTQRIELERKK